MTPRIVVLVAAAALLCVSRPCLARQQQPPPVRPLGTITGVTKDSLASVSAAVQVSGARVFVNDILARRVLLYDSTLANAVVVADSSGATANAYGSQPGTLLRYRGDSALFISPGTLSMLVLSPAGAITRVMAMPPSGGGLPALIGAIFGTPGFDGRGRLAYYAPVGLGFRAPPSPNGPMAMEPPDSALIVRFDFGTRTLDTAATIRIARSRTSVDRDDKGRVSITMTAFPPMTVDDWAVTADGSIAVVRGRDYHVDWLRPDGTWTSSPRMPYQWEHLNDDQKTALIDSTATAMQAMMDSLPARLQRAGAGGGADGPVVAGSGTNRRPPVPGQEGAPMTVTIVSPRGSAERGGGPANLTITTPTATRAQLTDVPDYRPPFRQGSVRADADGNLWIRTNTMVEGRPVYDIVNHDGQLTDRVQLPQFRTIAGFGPGVLYMGVRDSLGVMHLERARIR